MYKVVWNRNDKLISCCRSEMFDERLRVEYKIGEWVKPNLTGSKLFLFDSLKNVSLFSVGWRNTEVYLVEAKDPQPVEFISDIETIYNFWFNTTYYKNTNFDYQLIRAPQGTLMADEIKLVQKV